MGRMLRGRRALPSSSGAVGPSIARPIDSVNSRRKFLGKICLFACGPVTRGAIGKVPPCYALCTEDRLRGWTLDTKHDEVIFCASLIAWKASQ